MSRQEKKNIRIKIAVSAIVFSVMILRLLLRFVVRSSTYWFICSILDGFVYMLFIIVGVVCLISSIALIHKRRKVL